MGHHDYFLELLDSSLLRKDYNSILTWCKSYLRRRDDDTELLDQVSAIYINAYRRTRKADIVIDSCSFANNLKSFEYCKTSKIYSLYSDMGFGMYKGVCLFYILHSNAGYIIWLMINVDNFILDPRLLIKWKLRIQPDYELAFMRNIYKNFKYWDSWKSESRRIEEEQNYDNDYDPNDRMSYRDYLKDEYGDQAKTAYWNLD